MHGSNLLDIILFPINLAAGVILLPVLLIVGIGQSIFKRNKDKNKEKQL